MSALFIICRHITEMKVTKLSEYFDKMIYKKSELHDLNLSNYQINQLTKTGQLKKINNKYYENLNFDGDYNEFSLVNAYVETGIICLISAASYYNLTSVRTMEIEIAVHRKAKVRNLPDYPDVKVYYFSGKRYETGIVDVNNNGHHFKIYDLEKTVVDIIYYREKIGIEETKEIITNYLKRKDRDLNVLYNYAKNLNCEKILKSYMEVLL